MMPLVRLVLPQPVRDIFQIGLILFRHNEGGDACPAAGEQAVTSRGCAVLDALISARRAHLRDVLSEWAPEARHDLVSRLELLVEPRAR